jgi:hypothetical protein
MSNAFAKELLILEAPAKSTHTRVQSQFKINKELGRAWVVLKKYERRGKGHSHYRTAKVQVPGLSFEPETQSIVLENEGQIIECAKVKTKTIIFPINFIKKTGNCEIDYRFVKKSIDDGYEIKTRNFLQVYLNI